MAKLVITESTKHHCLEGLVCTITGTDDNTDFYQYFTELAGNQLVAKLDDGRVLRTSKVVGYMLDTSGEHVLITQNGRYCLREL